ncbi:MAG TPA: GMC oxidoreductase [Candidatus Limnocylindrales bacterium]
MAEREAFDVVVAGGGAAGCVVAARLAESASRSVLLLEAGPDLRADLPDDIRGGWHMTRDFDWGYASERKEFGDVQKIRRVKLLGGTSSIVRFAVRGSPMDYNEWAALGNPGWDFDGVLPYLLRLETDFEFGDQPWHGASGPIPVTRYPEVERTEVHRAALEALDAVGFPAVEDHNRPGAVGAGPMPFSSRDGRRVTTASAYLPDGGTPPNLTIRPDSQVDRIIFEGAGVGAIRATGVRLVDGSTISAACVVLSAGTYGSPPILMRSGIGPAKHLRSVGVDVRVDLAGVGANLADHPSIAIESEYRGPVRPEPLLHTIATFHSSRVAGDGPPDLMLWISEPVADPDGPTIFEIDPVLLKPRATGRVGLRSSDPADAPVISLPVPDQFDVERLAEAYRRGMEVANHPSVRAFCAVPSTPHLRGDELHEWIRQTVYSIPHVVGTCAMGPSPDTGAVVDAAGRVYGTEGLFVVDASIMPTVPSAFTHIPTIMIAERLSEQIGSFLGGS